MAKRARMQAAALAWLPLTAATLLGVAATAAAIEMSREGCGETKGCLFRPAGCNPALDCTLGMIFHVAGPNQLSVLLTATSLIPPPPLQYIAIGFSHDSVMGDDYVVECVLSPQGSAYGEPEVFASYNNPTKNNDRTYLNSTEHAILFNNVAGEVADMRLSCKFVVQIVPQMASKHGRVWSLNHKYYIFGATGSAQPDELNAHDTSQSSHYYPIVSARAINPALIGAKLYELPPPFPEPSSGAAATLTPADTTADAAASAAADEPLPRPTDATRTDATTTAAETTSAAPHLVLDSLDALLALFLVSLVMYRH